MPIPRIVFRYSWVYDDRFLYFYRLLSGKSKRDYPLRSAVLNYISVIEPEWRRFERKILSAISEISNLRWKEKEIPCYVVGKCIPFSDPLTICKYKNKNDFIDVLTHELIHQIFIHNLKIIQKYRNHLANKYKNESNVTLIHIPLHAIHTKIYLDLFNRRRLIRDVQKSNRHKDYRRSWEIVEKEGHDTIIKEFRKMI